MEQLWRAINRKQNTDIDKQKNRCFFDIKKSSERSDNTQ